MMLCCPCFSNLERKTDFTSNLNFTLFIFFLCISFSCVLRLSKKSLEWNEPQLYLISTAYAHSHTHIHTKPIYGVIYRKLCSCLSHFSFAQTTFYTSFHITFWCGSWISVKRAVCSLFVFSTMKKKKQGKQNLNMSVSALPF